MSARGVVREGQMAKKQLLTGEKYAGVDVTYDTSNHLVTLSGWYDTYVSIAPETVTLTQFLHQLNITTEDCRAALADVRRDTCACCGVAGWCYFDGEAMVCVDFKGCVARCRARDSAEAERGR